MERLSQSGIFSWKGMAYAMFLPVVFSCLAFFLLRDMEHLVLSGVWFTFESWSALDIVVLLSSGLLFFAIDPLVWRQMVKRNGASIGWHHLIWRSALIQSLALFTPGNIVEIWMRKVGAVSSTTEGIRLYLLKFVVYLLWSLGAVSLLFFPEYGPICVLIFLGMLFFIIRRTPWRYLLPFCFLYSLRFILLCLMHAWVLSSAPYCTSISFYKVILSHSAGGSIPSLPYFAPSVKTTIFSALQDGMGTITDFLISGQTLWFVNWCIALGIIAISGIYILLKKVFRTNKI